MKTKIKNCNTTKGEIMNNEWNKRKERIEEIKKEKKDKIGTLEFEKNLVTSYTFFSFKILLK